jgi:hypothetical protein
VKTGSLVLLACGIAGAAMIHRAFHGASFPGRGAAWTAHPDARQGAWVPWNPNPIGPVQGVWGERPDDVWAWSHGVMHWDGRTWTRVPGPPPSSQIIIVAEAAGKVWARTETIHPPGGSGCVVWGGSTERNDWCLVGDKWKSAKECGPSSPGGQASVAPPELVARPRVEPAELTHLWSARTNPLAGPSIDLERGYRVGGGELWAVDKTHQWLVHFDGHTWTAARNQSFGSPGALWFAGDDDGWALGDKTIQHWDGRDWKVAAETPEYLRAIWGTAADDVWAVGAFGLVMHFDGRVWSEDRLPGRPGLTTVVGRARDDVWIAGYGAGGFTAHWSGARWTPRSIDPADGFADRGSQVAPLVAPARDGRALAAVGDRMFEFSPAGWRETTSPVANADGAIALGGIAALAAGPEGDVWAVGSQNSGLDPPGPAPLVLRRVGDVWKKQDLALDLAAANAVWVRAADDVWVVGSNGVILHFDGGAWTREASGTDDNLLGIHGAGDTLWVIGAGGDVRRRRL